MLARATVTWLGLLAMALGMTLNGAIAASCSADGSGYGPLAGSEITALLVGSLACYPVTPPYENQEFLASGKITDHKQGSQESVDPSAVVGTYAVAANGTITYSYANGPSFTYTVWGLTRSGSGVYDLCAGGSPITVRVQVGSAGPC